MWDSQQQTIWKEICWERIAQGCENIREIFEIKGIYISGISGRGEAFNTVKT